MVRSCARRSFAAETIFMALVICCVFLTERMRRRISIKLGMSLCRWVLRHYSSLTPQSEPRASASGPSGLAVVPNLAVIVLGICLCRWVLRHEARLELFDNGLDLGGELLIQDFLGTDFVEHAAVRVVHEAV